MAKKKARTSKSAAAAPVVACEGSPIVPDLVAEASWADTAWKIRYLCGRAQVRLHYLHDEPAPGGKRKIYFAYVQPK